jgi:hypothetical protein
MHCRGRPVQATVGKSACVPQIWWQPDFFQEWLQRDSETHRYKRPPCAIDSLLLCCTALTNILIKKNDKNNGGLELDHICASSERLAMHKLPIVTLCLLAALSFMTVFICLSGAMTPRDTEYGSGKAVFKHYLVHYVGVNQ